MPVAICWFSALGTVCLNPVAEVLGKKRQEWGRGDGGGAAVAMAAGREEGAGPPLLGVDWLAARRGA